MRISDWSSDVCSSDLGEHASLGVLWKEFHAKGDDASDDDDHRRLFAKAFGLFNADQVDGYAPKPGPDLPESERLAAAEARSEERRAGNEWVSPGRSGW